MGVLAAILAAGGCAGPKAPVPSGFGGGCAAGPRIFGTAGMGVGNEGFITDLDARISVAAQTSGGCVGATTRSDNDDDI